MDEMEKERFKIRLDDDDDDDVEEQPQRRAEAPTRYEQMETVDDLKYSRLNRRLIMVATLIPCILGLALIFIYLDLKARSDQMRQSGANEIMGLSKDLDDRLNNLNQQAGGLKTEYERRIAELNQMVAEVKKKIQNADASINKIKTTQATPEDVKKAVKEIQADLDKTLATLKKESEAEANNLKSLKSDMAKIEEDLKQEFYPLVTRLSTDIIKLKTEMESLRKTADASRKIDQLSKAHESLKKQVDDLSRRLSRPAASPSSGPSSPTPPAGRPSGNGAPIGEQDISE